MGCRESTPAEEAAVSFPIQNEIDDARAIQLLKLQKQLVRRRTRGDARHVWEWVQSGDLPADVEVNMQAVGTFIFEGWLKCNDAGHLKLPASRYGSVKTLDTRDFLSGETGSKRIRGTCCAIGNSKILTAAHVFGETELGWLGANKLCVLFGFAKQPNGQTPTTFDPKFQMAKVVPPKDFDPTQRFQEEWLELDIEPSMSDLGRHHAIVSTDPLEDWAPVYMLGHPNGLSLRYVLSSTTVPGPESECFRAFIDGYDKASGSPVFDATSHKIVGIAVASGQNMGTVRIINQRHLSQVCIPITSRGTSCLRRPAIT